LPADLVDELADEAARLAKHVLKICVRAIDFCPPVDIQFGEFLRAIITADVELVPDDSWGYREALISAFRRRGIYPEGVPNLSEEALRWDRPTTPLPLIEQLNFAQLRFRGDPAVAASEEELERQALALGAWIATYAEARKTLGLATPDAGPENRAPCVESIRTLRRVGPDGQVMFDQVAEVTQVRTIAISDGQRPFTFLGGATVIIGPDGGVRYVIRKRVTNEERVQRQQNYMAGAGRKYWGQSGGASTPVESAFRQLHARSSGTIRRQPKLQPPKEPGVGPRTRRARREDGKTRKA